MNKQAFLDGYFKSSILGKSGFNPERLGQGEESDIDTSRPKLLNPDGSFSTERTITVSFDDGVYNIPTIKDGERLSSKEAIKEFKNGRIKPVGKYKTVEEAEEAAEARSGSIGRIRGNE